MPDELHPDRKPARRELVPDERVELRERLIVIAEGQRAEQSQESVPRPVGVEV